MPMEVSRLPVQIETLSHITPNTEIFFPAVIGMEDKNIQEKMNKKIYDQVQRLIQKQKKVQIEGETSMDGFFELKTNERGVLSLTQGNYAYTPPMAHGMTYLKSLTFDTRTGKNYLLSELFKPDSDYVSAISDLIRAQIQDREIPVLGEFREIRPNQPYYIADKCLVIYFQLYEITPYYVGFPMFPISVYKLEDMMEENSPLAKMLADL